MPKNYIQIIFKADYILCKNEYEKKWDIFYFLDKSIEWNNQRFKIADIRHSIKISLELGKDEKLKQVVAYREKIVKNLRENVQNTRISSNASFTDCQNRDTKLISLMKEEIKSLKKKCNFLEKKMEGCILGNNFF